MNRSKIPIATKTETELPLLFHNLPQFPPALPDADLRFLVRLPEWPTTVDIELEDRAMARRLAKKGLVKITRQSDPLGGYATWSVGKIMKLRIRFPKDFT